MQEKQCIYSMELAYICIFRVAPQTLISKVKITIMRQFLSVFSEKHKKEHSSKQIIKLHLRLFHLRECSFGLVPLTGLEPVRCLQRGIFVLLYVTIATQNRVLQSGLGLYHILSNLGSRCKVSTLTLMGQHGVLFAPSPFQPTSTPQISLRALSADQLQTHITMRANIKVPCVCLFHHSGN